MTDPKTKITLNELDSHLWEAANILRGSPVDRTDWKSYILPLLFLKRICDVYDEEIAEAIADFGDPNQLQLFPELHRFSIPEGKHWSSIREKATEIGKALQESMRAIESANQDHLYGVFGDAQWTNRERLPDDLLKDLVEHFSKIPLGNTAVDRDIMGDAYEILIGRFADATNKKAGEFYTPRSVVKLLVDILDPKEGESIYDPACGTGGMLLAAVSLAQSKGIDHRKFFGKLHGQEKNLTTSAVARMNLFLHGLEDFEIAHGDTLRNPAFTANDKLKTFDCVLANPPFSLKDWGMEAWKTDPWGRNIAGTPTDKSADFAWIQHMICSMAPEKGRMAVVLPQGALFRSGAEGKIRTEILKKDYVEAVIGLAGNLFFGTGLAACVMVLRKKKPAERKNKVLVVDASSLVRVARAQSFLDPEHAAEILKMVQDFKDVKDKARVVELKEIKEEEYTLNISRYVLPPIGEDIPPLPEAIASFKTALAQAKAAEDKLKRIMEEEGWLQ